jgi:hypothetical protein
VSFYELKLLPFQKLLTQLLLLFNEPAAVHNPFMDDIAFIIDEREAVRADFIGRDDVSVLRGTKKGQPDGGTEYGKKDAVLAFEAMETSFQLRGGD